MLLVTAEKNDDRVSTSKTLKQTRLPYPKLISKVHRIDDSLSVAIVGIPADCKHLIQMMRVDAEQYRSNYGVVIPLSLLADHVSSYLHDFTIASDIRPLAISGLIFCSKSNNIVKIDCDGSYDSYRGVCSTDTDDIEEDMAISVALRRRLFIEYEQEEEGDEAREGGQCHSGSSLLRRLTCQEATREVEKILQSVVSLPDLNSDISDSDTSRGSDRGSGDGKEEETTKEKLTDGDRHNWSYKVLEVRYFK